MSSFAELAAKNLATKSFITAEEAEEARRQRDEAYRRMGKEPPPEVGSDARPLAERLAEQRRIKEEDEEAKMALANHVPMLDEEDAEYLNDVALAQREAELEQQERERREIERFRLERERAEEAARKAAGADPIPIAELAASTRPSLVRELLLDANQIDDDAASSYRSAAAKRVPAVVKTSFSARSATARVAGDVQRSILSAGIVTRKRQNSEPEQQSGADAKRTRTRSPARSSPTKTTAAPPRPAAAPAPVPAPAAKKMLVAYDSDESDEDD
ncbi:hypothetical protein H9P43_006346 [Blastocladiella emersonii ATCC 22665]|nr:hypothetical protein H9P43_006346 [Blastocladiella emersonii ATCC 22665]